MKLVLVKHNEVPPESGGIMGYRYTHPETGHISHARDVDGWKQAIDKYRSDNGFPPIEMADAVDQLCKLLPRGWCKYSDGTKPSWFVNTRLQVGDLVNGTKVLAGFIYKGMPLVSKELAESRSETCARCPFNVDISGCQPCSDLAAIVISIGGDLKTKSDPSLKHCAICLCSNLAQTRVPIDILRRGVTPEMADKFKSVDWCWKAKELFSPIDADAAPK